MEYLAVDRLRALIAQEAEIEQIKAQEVILQDAIEEQKDKDNASVRAGETPSIEIQGPRTVTKTGH